MEDLKLDKELFRNIRKVGNIWIGELKVSKATISKWNYRPTHSKEDLEEIKATLGKSIEEIGLRQLPECNTKGEVFAGGRRLSAFKELKLEWIPVVIRDTKPEDEFIASFAENRHRKDPDYLEDGRKFREYCETFKISIRELARRLGVSPSYISHRISIYEHLFGKKKDVLDENNIAEQITYEEARILASPEIPEEKREELLEQVAKDKMEYPDLARVIKTSKAVKELLDTTQDKIKEKVLKKIENKLWTPKLSYDEVLEEIKREEGQVILKRIELEGNFFKSEQEADEYAKQFGGRFIERKIVWILEVDPKLWCEGGKNDK